MTSARPAWVRSAQPHGYPRGYTCNIYDAESSLLKH